MANWRNPSFKQTTLRSLTYALAMFLAIQPSAVVYGALCDFTPSGFDDVSVYEEQPIGTLLYTLDVEGDTTSEITLSLDDCNNGSSTLLCDQVWDFEDKSISWAMIYDLESNETNCEGAYTIGISCTVNGSPPSSTNFQLYVFIYDVNDNDPVFVGTPYETNVGELAEIGHTVYVVLSEDRDCNSKQPVYDVIGGTGKDYFSFETTNSPNILVTNLLDYELDTEYTLTLMVDDRDGRNSTTDMDIHVIDEDDMMPMFSEVRYETEVLENSEEAVLLVIPTVHAYDQDFGINETVYYSFADPDRQNDAIFEIKHFTIDNITAGITVTSGLDRESLENGTLTVMLRAAQVNSFGYHLYSYRDTQASLVVTVLDVNDNAPIMSDDEYYGTVPEHSPSGTIVCGVMATDLDEGDNALFKFVVDSEIFKVDDPMSVTPNTAIAYVRVNDSTLLDFETLPGEDFHIEVYAVETETSELLRSNASLIWINITDINDNAPVFLNEPYSASVYENVTEPIYLMTIETDDADTGLDGEVAYSIYSATDNGMSIFTIDQDTGDLSATFYHLLDADTIDSYVIFVMAADKGEPPRSNLTEVHIEVINVNDEPPEFIDAPFSASISEGALVGASVFNISAYDVDGDQLTFSFGNDRNVSDDGHFFVDSVTGEVFIFDLLDRESQAHHNMTVSVTDGYFTANDTDLSVIVTDINDNDPFIDAVNQTVTILEEEEGAVITYVEAYDIDEEQNADISFHIAEPMQGNFRVDSDGKVYTAQPLDREKQAVHPVYVLAIDGGESPRTGETLVTVYLQDINDNAPQFEEDIYMGIALEGIPGFKVATVRANDEDDDADNGEVRYAILDKNGTDYDYFDVDEVTGEVFITSSVLIEDAGEILTVDIEAFNPVPYDIDGIVNDTTSVEVTLKALNDSNVHSPEFNQSSYSMETEENDYPGGTFNVFVGQVFAEDKDGDITRYEILYGNEGGQFNISEDGTISTAGVIDREAQPWHTLIVIAEDDGEPSRMGITEVKIEVLDVNDNLPVLVKRDYNATIKNGTSNQVIVNVTATDEDIGENGRVIYEIIDGENYDKLQINSETGEMYLSEQLTDETEAMISVQVVVYNPTAYVGGDSAINDTATVKIMVEGHCNLEDPIFNETSYSFDVLEDESDGTVVGTVRAHDPDTGSVITAYDIIYGADDKFSISQDGAIRKIGDIDREAVDTYTLIVNGVDKGYAPRTSVTEVVITVLDVNDNDPEFAKDSYSGNITENSDAGQYIVIVPEIQVTDADIGSNAVIYLRLTGDGSADFNINIEDDGFARVVVNGSLDSETIQRYDLEIEASNNPGDFDNATVVPLEITLLDLNDNEPTFDPHEPFEVVEIEPVGYLVGAVSAFDPDVDERNNKVQYYFIDGDYGKFDIDRDTGNITVADTLYGNITGRYSYNITVMAYNSGYDRDHESYNYVIIEVGDYYNVPPQFPQPAYRDDVYENATIGSYVTTVKAYDYNSGRNGELVYEILSDEDVPFAIDNNGTITVDGNLDRETKDHYIFEVVATDGGMPPMSASVQVRIDILDVNDNPPVFCPDSYTTATIDGTMPEISVLKVLATDADEGSNAEIRYSLRGDGHEYFKVDECTGLVQIQQKIDSELMYEEGILEPLNITNMTAYRMVIESVATDLGHPSLSGYANVTIIIYDSIYDYPQFNETTYLDDVRENEEAGTFVTRVHATVNTPDIEVFYGILDPSEVFQIDRVTGDITTLIPLDRESRDVYDVTVRAEADIPPVYPNTYTTVTVIVTDVNDNAPAFNASSYAFSVFENATKWTFLGQVAATDLDLEENAEIGYYIIGGEEGDQFYINDTNGELFVHDDLDREETASYALIVMAEDKGFEMTLNSSVVVDITLLDVNDNPPSFDDTFYQGELSENDPPGTSITTLSAEDPDIGINAVVLYKVNNNVDCDHCFYVEEYSGVLRNTRVLEDMTGSYDVEVEAYNLNDISLNDKTVVNTTVTVAPTVIATSPLLATTLFSGTSPATPISETGSTPATGLSPVSEVTPFTGTVTDGTPGGPGTSVQPETGSPPTGTQPVSGTRSETGSPPTGGHPGTSSPATGVSPVSPVTPGVPTHTPIATLTPTSFTTPPVDRLLFEYNEYKETIVYNHTVGSEVVTVTATYNGEELEDTFYEIIKEIYTENMTAIPRETNHFEVDSSTGNITLSKALDENFIGLYTLSVDAYNETNPTDPLQRDSTTVSIRVVGFDNEAPYFDPKSYQGSVTDIDPEGTYIVTVTASDPDYPTYGTGEITYEIADTWALGYFEIGETSGEITRGSIPFCGLQDVVTFDVRAVDGGIPPLYDTANVTVDIEYIENINAPSVESNETDIPENTPIGSLVIKVVATDDDDGDAGEIDRYGIKYEGGNTKDGENKFTINVNTGEIHTSDDFDYDEKEERYYQIIVYAVDKGVPEKTGYGTIEVYITDVNDNIPEFVSVEDTFYVKEAQNASEFVGKVHATDIDSGVNALITYTIEDGDEAGHFHINNETGRIYTSTVLEYTGNPYQLTLGAANIYAEMNSDLKQMKNVAVHVVDINNNAPEFTNAPYEENIRMDVDIGYSVLTVQASDDDVGYNGDVAYALDVCDDAGCSTEALMYFAIDRTTGVLTVAAQFTPKEGIAIQTYLFKVIAFDNGSPRLESDSIVTITVQDQDFDQPIFRDQYDSVEMLEEQDPQDTCELLPGVDYDDFGQVSYFFTGGDCDYVDRFELVKRADSYEICNAKILDREEISSYRFIITAFANRGEVPPCEGTSDFTGLSSNQLGLLVNISDLNEHPYFDDQIFYFKGIDDTTPFGVSVFQVSAIDNDEGDNAVLCYTDDSEHFDTSCHSGDIYTTEPNYVGKARSADIFNVTATDGGVEPLSNSTEVKMYILAVEDYCILESRLPRTEIASNLNQILGELGMLHDYIFMFDSTLVTDSPSNNPEAMTDMWFYVTDISAYEVIECEEFLSEHCNLPVAKCIGAQLFDTTPEKFVDDWEVEEVVTISDRAHVYKRASSTPAYAIYLLVLAIVIFIVALILVIYLMVEDKFSQKKLLEQKEFLERMASFRKQPVRFAESTGETSDDRTVLDVGTDMDDEPLLRTPNVKYIPRTVVYEEQELSMDVFQEPSEHGDDWSYGDTLNALEEIQPVAIDNPGFMDDYGQYIKLEPDEDTTEDTQGRHHDSTPAPNPVAVLSEPQLESEQPLRSTAGDTPVSAAAEDHKNEDSKPSRILPNQYNPLVPLPPLPPPPQIKEPSVTSESESESPLVGDKSEPTPEKKDEPPVESTTFPPPPPLVISPETQGKVAEPEADIPQLPVQSFEKYHQPTPTSHPPPLPPVPPPPPPVIRQDDVISLQSERSDTPSSVIVRDTDQVIFSTLDDAVPSEGGHRPTWPITTDDFPPPPSQDDATSLQSGQSDTPSSVIVRDTDQVIFSTLDELSDADSEEAPSTVKAFTNPMYRMFDNNDDGGGKEEIEMNGFTNGDQFDAAGDDLYNDDGEDGGASRPTRKRMDDTVCAEDEILEKRRVVTFNDEVEEHYDERFPDEPEDVFTTF